MSQLKLYSADGYDAAPVDCTSNDERPMILSFKSHQRRFLHSSDSWDLLSRARTVFHNRQCRYCDHPVVEPIELDDAVLNRNQMPMPSTATLVGFHCSGCHAEWPA